MADSELLLWAQFKPEKTEYRFWQEKPLTVWIEHIRPPCDYILTGLSYRFSDSARLQDIHTFLGSVPESELTEYVDDETLQAPRWLVQLVAQRRTIIEIPFMFLPMGKENNWQCGYGLKNRETVGLICEGPEFTPAPGFEVWVGLHGCPVPATPRNAL